MMSACNNTESEYEANLWDMQAYMCSCDVILLVNYTKIILIKLPVNYSVLSKRLFFCIEKLIFLYASACS